MKTFDNGSRYTRFSLAQNHSFKNSKGQLIRETYWFSAVAWADMAQRIVEEFQKGNLAAIAGRLISRTWNDKDGNKRTTIEVVISEIYPVDQKKKEEELEN
jgi:single-strand DNA-binding protein